jgi:hypothetical protein
MCKGSSSVLRNTREEFIPVDQKRRFNLCPQAREIPVLLQVGTNGTYQKIIVRWKYSVGEVVLVRTRDEWMKVIQRRIEYGHQCYRLEDDSREPESNLVALREFTFPEDQQHLKPVKQ